MAADVWAGMLRHRNDCLDYLAVRYCAVWRRGFSSFTAASGPDDRSRHGNAEDVAGAEARVGADARAEMVYLDGSVLERGRPIQRLFGSAGCRSHRAGGRLRDRLPRPGRGGVLCPVETGRTKRTYCSWP